jgi:uncharacterized protein (DUF58 family)
MDAALPDPRVLAAVRALEVRARRAVRAGLGGAWPSAVRGPGVEFAEVREYVVGDDARTIDWNVTARTARPQVKRFDEEREQTLLFLLDGSRSTRVAPGARPWREAAAELLLLVGLSAAGAGDRIGALFWSGGADRLVPPRHGANALLALATEWLSWEGGSDATDLGATLAALLRVRHRPALLLIVTDGHALPDDAIVAQAARRHDVVFMVVRAGLLARLPERGRWRFDDPEGGARHVVDLGSPAVRAALLARMEAARAAARARVVRLGAEWLELDGDGDLVAPLLEWARRRAARHVRGAAS